MTLQEYIAMAKSELDEMEKKWIAKNNANPQNWPMKMSAAEWGEQELAERFS